MRATNEQHIQAAIDAIEENAAKKINADDALGVYARLKDAQIAFLRAYFNERDRNTKVDDVIEGLALMMGAIVATTATSLCIEGMKHVAIIDLSQRILSQGIRMADDTNQGVRHFEVSNEEAGRA
jgi:hypothetical protein